MVTDRRAGQRNVPHVGKQPHSRTITGTWRRKRMDQTSTKTIQQKVAELVIGKYYKIEYIDHGEYELETSHIADIDKHFFTLVNAGSLRALFTDTFNIQHVLLEVEIGTGWNGSEDKVESIHKLVDILAFAIIKLTEYKEVE